jgi:hypothetical protein
VLGLWLGGELHALEHLLEHGCEATCATCCVTATVLAMAETPVTGTFILAPDVERAPATVSVAHPRQVLISSRPCRAPPLPR